MYFFLSKKYENRPTGAHEHKKKHLFIKSRRWEIFAWWLGAKTKFAQTQSFLGDI